MKPASNHLFASATALALILFLLSLGCTQPTEPEATSTPLAIPGADRPTPSGEVLPQFVVDAVAAALPGASLIAASREEEDGQTTYEVLARTGEGDFEVDVAPDGTVLEVEPAADEERPIAPSDLPAAVRAAVEATVPGGRITEAARQSIRGQVVYDVEVDVRGEKYDLEVAEDGTVLEVDEGD